MTAVDDILSRIPLADLAARLGVDEGTAEEATRQALPALLGGIEANTADPGGAESFASAVRQHDNDLIEGGVNLDDVDENDGDRIVGHVFGDQRGQVVRQLGTTGGASTTSDLMGKLLPILAPIVMAYLAKRLGGGAAAGGQSGGIGDLLGSILGGMARPAGRRSRGSRAGWAGCSEDRSATFWAACSAAAAAPEPHHTPSKLTHTACHRHTCCDRCDSLTHRATARRGL